ncbi:MAG: indolepyruvate oxidoreductase subunit beta [Candidatus Promineifilaceae bacterium]
MTEVYNLLFAGVGGQGSLLVAELTSIAATQAGYDVKQTEVHGVSQRGGSVETHVRFGDKIYSPIITPGQADAVVALEKLEALRFAHFVDPKSGVILVNDFEVIPGSVSGASDAYPHETIAYLREKGLTVYPLPASDIARNLGDGRMANVVMLGALSTRLSIPDVSWQKALTVRLPARYLDSNLTAFANGKRLMAMETLE